MNASLPLLLSRCAALCLLTAFVSNTAYAQTTAGGQPAAGTTAEKPKPLGTADKKFIKDAAASIFYQLKLVGTAKTGATAESTKLVSTTATKELGKAWEDLANLATPKNEKMPAELSSADKQSVERLGKLKEDKFDKPFLKEFSKESKRLVQTFTMADKTLQDPELKAYAAKWLPVLTTQLTDADKAESEAGKRK